MNKIEAGLSRRDLGKYLLLAGGAAALGGCAQAAPAKVTEIVVYKSATCGCCNKWIDHLTEAGYDVTAHDSEEMSQYKASVGVPARLQSCHTAMIDGYVIEGHVPAREIGKLLTERPDAIGLSVPGMPSGSPGMENGRVDNYDVVLFSKDGEDVVYASY